VFAIAPYHVEVLDSRRQPQDLWNFYHKNSLRDHVAKYLKSIVDLPINSDPTKAFVLRKIFASTPESIGGVFRTGLMGFESEIFNVAAKAVTHNRKKEEADLVPFPFSFYMPKNVHASQRTRGLLLLSRFNTSGIRGIVVPHLRSNFAATFPDYTLNVERVLPDTVMKSLLANGEVKKIRLVKKTLPKDYADVLSDSDKQKFADLEVVLRTKKNCVFSDVDWLMKLLDKKSNINSVFTLPDFTPDNIKVELNHGGKSRTVNVGSPGQISSNIDISHVAVDGTGHIASQDWLNEADDLASEIFQSWGARGVAWKSKV